MRETRLIVDIKKSFGVFNLQMRLEVGTEVFVLFGPSGAGKTQTLNAIAGLMTPDAGEITLDGKPFFRHQDGSRINLPARRRHVGYVFQQYALFPHLTALENVAYSLWRQHGAQKQAAELLGRMHLERLADRYPHEMSGGQQQRVAIARALAADSRVLLLDEPFSALDSANRERLHKDLLAIQAESQLVVLYVTHNLDEAFAVGHRLAIIYEGRVEQVGTPDTIFRNPANVNVLKALGIANSFQARVLGTDPAGLQLDWQGLLLEAPPQTFATGDTVTAYIRPEDLKIIPGAPADILGSDNHLTGTVTHKQAGRHFHTLRVMLKNDHEIEVAVSASTPLETLPEREAHLTFQKEDLKVLPL